MSKWKGALLFSAAYFAYWSIFLIDENRLIYQARPTDTWRPPVTTPTPAPTPTPIPTPIPTPTPAPKPDFERAYARESTYPDWWPGTPAPNRINYSLKIKPFLNEANSLGVLDLYRDA